MRLWILAAAVPVVLLGCANEGGRTEVAASDTPTAIANEARGLDAETRQALSSYYTGAVFGCKSKIAYRAIENMGGSPGVDQPVPASSDVFNEVYASASGFEGLQTTLKSVRAAEMGCHSSPREGADEAVLDSVSALKAEMEILPSSAPE